MTASQPLDDNEQARLYRFCERDPAMYSLVRRLATHGLLPDPPAFDEQPSSNPKANLVTPDMTPAEAVTVARPVSSEEWTPFTDHLFQSCCDCGLSHRVDVRRTADGFEVRFSRLPEYTEEMRKLRAAVETTEVLPPLTEENEAQVAEVLRQSNEKFGPPWSTAQETTAVLDFATPDKSKPWTCPKCQQLNSANTRHCGRCEDL